jgi:4-amino-4-deoxy-L-arabinose transferase-like glycosyltransferase
VTKGRRGAVGLLLAAALGLAALGQFYFWFRRQYLWDGALFHGLAVLCFIQAWYLSRPGRPQVSHRRLSQVDAWLRERPLPAALVAAGLFLSFAATLLSRDRALDQSMTGPVILWILGLAAVAWAALGPASRPLRLREIRRETWLEVATVAGLVVLAFVLRVAALGNVPYTLGGDEAWHGQLARQVLEGKLRNPFSMGYMSMPTFFYWPLSWSLWLVGNTMTGLRMPAALAGVITVPLLYLFARDLWGRRTALLATIFLATYDYHVHYSRLGANNVWDPLFVLLVLWALDRGLTAAGEVKQARAFFLAGLVMGLSVYFYTGARLLPPLVAIYTAFVWLRRRRQVERLGVHLTLLALAFLVAAGPMLCYALSHPNEWNARINQVGIIQSGWLEREPGLTGKSTPQILAEQFLRAAGAFHVFPDRTVWYGAARPLLSFWGGIFALLGMTWALVRWRDRRYFLVLIWFWSVIITGGMLTESPPSSQRLVIAIPAVALLVTFGLEQSARLARRVLAFKWSWENLAVGLLILILAVGNIRFYFVEFTPARCYGSENGETATMIGHYLRDLDRRSHVYFFGAPRIYWNFGTMTFIAPGVSGQDVVEPLDAPPHFVDASRDATFLFLPERLGELAWVRQTFPDGHLQEFPDAGGEVRFVAYEVSK